LSFSIVLPVKGTEKELGFLPKAIKSACKLNPDEIVFGLDDDKLIPILTDLCCRNNFIDYTFVVSPNNGNWQFNLANVIWHCYKHCKHDRILSFDVDSKVTGNVLLGLDEIGTNDIAVLSFTKKLLIRGLRDVIKYAAYRARVRRSNYVFSGVYWIWRPYFFDSIKLEKYQRIKNGIDTFLTETILEEKKYVIKTRKEIGVICMDIQNEDYPWRQFQVGIWIRANEFIPTKDYKTIRDIKLINWRNASLTGLLVLLLRIFAYRNPKSFIYTKAIVYNHPYLVKGFNWADHNMESESVQTAKKMTFNDWGYTGSKYLPKMNWERGGTGF